MCKINKAHEISGTYHTDLTLNKQIGGKKNVDTYCTCNYCILCI